MSCRYYILNSLEFILLFEFKLRNRANESEIMPTSYVKTDQVRFTNNNRIMKTTNGKFCLLTTSGIVSLYKQNKYKDETIKPNLISKS